MLQAAPTSSMPRAPVARSLPPALRVRLEEAVERLLAALDALDAEAEDLEPQGDEEPSLGSNASIDQRLAWQGSTDDREAPEDDEPSLGWHNWCPPRADEQQIDHLCDAE